MKRTLVSVARDGITIDMQPDDMITEKTTNIQHRQYTNTPIHLLLSASISKRRRVAVMNEESCATPMDISYDTDESMTVSTEYHYLLDLPTEMLSHIFSFLPLPDLCRGAEICTSTYAVVRFYTLSV
jgi:hypothetical protein